MIANPRIHKTHDINPHILTHPLSLPNPSPVPFPTVIPIPFIPIIILTPLLPLILILIRIRHHPLRQPQIIIPPFPLPLQLNRARPKLVLRVVVHQVSVLVDGKDRVRGDGGREEVAD